MKDLAKIKAFNAKMGRTPKPKYSKGGMIRKIAGRHYFDDGGVTTAGTGSTTIANNTAGTYQNGLVNNPVANGVTWGLSGNAGNLVGEGENSIGGAAQGLASAFTTQNGYQAQEAPTTESNYSPIVATGANTAAAGYNQFNQNLEQEQALNSQLGQIAAGQGPNPAQTVLAQNTATNVANQGALMAGQRGASSNVGLIARQAAQTGAATQQAAVGQAATNQANQSLNAVGQQQTLLGNTGSQITSEQNANTGLLGTAASAQNAQNNTNVANAGMAQGINAQTAQNNANAVNSTESGLLGGAGSIASSLFASGGDVEAPSSPEPNSPSVNIPSFVTTPSSSSSSSSGSAGGGGSGLGSLVGLAAAAFAKGGNICAGPHGHVAAFLSGGGPVEAMVSPQERYLNPEEVRKVVHEGADPLKLGKVFKGKAKKAGDSLKNDTIPATLEEGGCVLPRHVTKMKGPHKSERAALFIHKAMHMKKPQGAK
jgi:hypothetical protein